MVRGLGRAAAAQLLRRSPDVDAVFCASDQLARGVADGLRDLGVGVPGEVALVGFDNWDVMVHGSRPPLTTVDSKLIRPGREAANRLVAAIDGGELGSGTVLQPCELLVHQLIPNISGVVRGTAGHGPLCP